MMKIIDLSEDKSTLTFTLNGVKRTASNQGNGNFMFSYVDEFRRHVRVVLTPRLPK